MNKIILKIFDFFQHRKALLWMLLSAMLLLLLFSASRISFVEDISSFLPNNAENKRSNEAYQHIGAANKIIVTISQKDTAANYDETLLIDAATRFSEILQENDSVGHIKELLYEIDNEKINRVSNFIIENLPFFLEEDDYRKMDSLLNKQSIENQLKIDKELLMSPMGAFVRNVILRDPLHFSQNALKQLEGFKLNDNTNTSNGFIFNKMGECLVTVTSKYPVSETANNKLLAKEIYKAASQTITEFDNEVQVMPFGAALISITNADQIKNDSIFAVSVALILIFILLFYFFRNLKSLFFIAVSVVFGALFSLGIIVLFKSTVSIIALGISSIIFGIAINYPLHFLAHNQHSSSVKHTLKEIVNPLLVGNITTVGAFLSLLFISSDAMKDLGLFSSLLLVGSIFFVLVFLPHFIKTPKSKRIHKTLAFGRVSEFSPEKNKLIVLVFLIFTVVLFFFSFGTKFESNLHAINYMTDDQRTEMHKLIAQNSGQGKTIYVVNECRDIDDALWINENWVQKKMADLKSNNSIIAYSGIGNFLPSHFLQQEKIKRWELFWESRKTDFVKDFNEISQKQNFNKGVFDDFIALLDKDFQVQSFEYFYEPIQNLAENYVVKTDDKYLIYSILQSAPETVAAVEKSIIEKPTSLKNNRLTDYDGVFTFDDTSIAQKMVSALSDDFNHVLYICGFIVFAFLLFSFGRIEIAILTFIPLTVGWIWILGLMNIFDLKFNIVNIILATFIFGQGDDYTIFVTEGLIHEYTYRKKMLASFKNSILLSASILLIAIGMLIFAKHPAMRSLAELTIVGMISVLMCAYLFPPLIFRYLTTKKEKVRIMPITIWNWLKTVFSFLFFFVSSIIVTVFGFFIVTLGGNSKKRKLLYHRFLCSSFKFLAHCMPQVKYKVHNLSGETFEKPAVIVCNHQSHLDLLYTLMLSPKVITLTNRWVWNSPFYGWIIRYADFLPVADGIEQHVDKLKQLVDDGYSILVFPEGTRSEDCSINRFRKGAFYLADRLNLDIIPLVSHGIGHILPKKEFVLRKGQVDIEIHSRINIKQLNIKLSKEGELYNEDLALLETAKYFRNFYIEKYVDLANRVETADYFADKVLKNYIYKGASVERRAKALLKKHNNFKDIIDKLPDEGELFVQNSGQGEFALLCALVKKKLKITALEQDIDVLEIAKNCASVPENLFYIDKMQNPINYVNLVTFDSNGNVELKLKREG